MKNIIKTVAVILLSMLLFCSVINVSAAKLTWSPVMKVDTVTAARGDTVYLNVVLEESAEGIMASTFSLLYDNSALSYVNYAKGIFYDTPEVVDHGDYVSIVMCDNTTNFKLGNIITIEFKVKDDATGGFYPIKMANVRPREKGESLKGCFANWRGDTINPIVTNGGVNIPLTQENCKHSFSDWTVKIEPTCEEKGLKNRFCSNCGKNENQDIAEKTHEIDDFWTIDRPATVDEDGVMSRHCKNCDYKIDYVTFKVENSEDNDFENEENETLDENNWSELENFRTEENTDNPKDNPQIDQPVEEAPHKEEKPSQPEEIPDSADDLILNRTEKKENYGIAGKIYRYLYGKNGESGILSIIIRAFNDFFSNIIF